MCFMYFLCPATHHRVFYNGLVGPVIRGEHSHQERCVIVWFLCNRQAIFYMKKSRIRETLNYSNNADRSNTMDVRDAMDMRDDMGDPIP